MLNKTICAAVAAIGLLAVSGCGSHASKAASAEQKQLSHAPFCTDSVMTFIARQLGFGPRIPGSPASRECAEWIVEFLRTHGADSIIVQDAPEIPARNILARFNGTAPQPRKRILLLAHYDTRPWADQDSDPANRHKPVPGANDGASGVAVLLETARQISLDRPGCDIDILFVDNEDSGISDGGPESSDSWARGTQAWVRNMPYGSEEQTPAFAVLLDMVGGKGARFNREYYSDQLAPQIVDKVWALANALGLAGRFPDSPGGAVVDDHLWVNKAGIPAIDIIESMNSETGSFPPHWHTLADDIGIIDPSTLDAVGKVVNTLIRNESPK